MAVDVVADDLQDDVDIDLARWRSLAARALAEELAATSAVTDEVDVEVTLTFVDADEMAALNREQMGIDGPTDVLSFPLDDPASASRSEPLLIGDVVICPAVARLAVDTHAGTLDDEIALLVVHGILHLLGHDHADAEEAARMRRRERDLLERWHWDGPVPPGFSFDHLDR